MKLVIVSDTHNKHHKLVLPEGDVFIHCGDSTIMGTLKETAAFANWFRSLDYKYKIVIAGNHDYLFQDHNSLARSMFDHDNCYYLEDSGLEIEGMLFWGSPWVSPIGKWAFCLEEKLRDLKWNNIPSVTEVLITHTPPRDILDWIWLASPPRSEVDKEHLGCARLKSRFASLVPSIHCFGHIHEAYGIDKHQDTTFINASSCNEEYELVNKPIEIEI